MELVEKTGVTIGTARARLSRSKDPEYIFKKNLKVRDEVIYTLDDGSEWRVYDVMNVTSMSEAACKARLAKHTDPEIVLKHRKAGNGAEICDDKVMEKIGGRMFFDPLGHWALLNKCL
jgi:hypothetical protein